MKVLILPLVLLVLGACVPQLGPGQVATRVIVPPGGNPFAANSVNVACRNASGGNLQIYIQCVQQQGYRVAISGGNTYTTQTPSSQYGSQYALGQRLAQQQMSAPGPRYVPPELSREDLIRHQAVNDCIAEMPSWVRNSGQGSWAVQGWVKNCQQNPKMPAEREAESKEANQFINAIIEGNKILAAKGYPTPPGYDPFYDPHTRQPRNDEEQQACFREKMAFDEEDHLFDVRAEPNCDRDYYHWHP